MKGKAIIPLVLGLGVGLVAVKLGVDTIKKSQASTANRTTVTALRATVDIDARVEITAEMIEEIKTEVNAFLPTDELFETSKEVVGRVTARVISQGSPVLKSALTPPGTEVGVEGAIEPGYLAYSVEIKDEASSVAYQIKRGTWVDVIVVMKIQGERRKQETISEVLLQHVQVLAVGRTASGAQPESNTKAKAAKSVTLHVPENDVPKLHWAAMEGEIALAMRGDNEPIATTRPPTRLDDLFQKNQPQDPAPRSSEPGNAPQPSLWQNAWKSFAQKGAMETTSSVEIQPEPEPDPQWEVVVFRNSTKAKGGGTVERIVYENSRSRKVVTAAEGKQSTKGSSQHTGRNSRVQVAPGVRTDKPDQAPGDEQEEDDSDTGKESE